MQNKPNFQNAKNTLTLVDTRNYNKLRAVSYYSKQTQSNPISVGLAIYLVSFGVPWNAFGCPLMRDDER